MSGILSNGQPQVADQLTTKILPFMPVPDAYGFHNKYQILSIPSFIFIDTIGNVAAFTEGPDYQKLKQTLSRVTR